MRDRACRGGFIVSLASDARSTGIGSTCCASRNSERWYATRGGLDSAGGSDRLAVRTTIAGSGSALVSLLIVTQAPLDSLAGNAVTITAVALETDPLDPDNTILAVGGSRPALESFVAFRGRPPTIDALLRHSGMSQ